MAQPNPVAFIINPTPLTWDQANAAAQAIGGRLWFDTLDVDYNWRSDLGDLLDDYRYYEDPAWFGITAAPGGGYVWLDGSPVQDLKFVLGIDPNADANPDNDTLHPLLIGESWRSEISDSEPPAPREVSQYIVEFTNSASIAGGALGELFLGGAGPGQVLRANGGDDIFYGHGGGKVYLGSGDDLARIGEFEGQPPWLVRPNPPLPPSSQTIVYDGDGADRVDGSSRFFTLVVSAAIDGDADSFEFVDRVSYADDTAGFTISGGGLRSGGVTSGAMGADSLQSVLEIVGGSGDDDLRGVARMQGGKGDDILRPGSILQDDVAAAYAEGGDGDDTLYTSALARAELRGGAGDDTFILSHASKVSGGTGADTFRFESVAAVTINDLSTGDLIEVSGLFDAPLQDAFEDGYLATSISKGYTTLSIDADGGGDEFTTLAVLKGVFPDLSGFLV